MGIYGCGLDGVDVLEAFVELLSNNDILVGDSWEDHGQGADIGSLSIAHETLKEIGIKPENIKLIKNDMAYTPNFLVQLEVAAQMLLLVMLFE